MNRPTRRSRFLTVCVSLCALLFAQFALAGYACPAQAKAAELAQMAEAGLPCAQAMSTAMDDQQPGLCHAHCQAGQATTDSHHPPALASLVALGMVLSIRLSPIEDAPRPWSLGRHSPVEPPKAIRHCCLRI